MKPQLLLSPLETAGYHGAPKKTKARLEKSASWKRQRIVVILPAGAQVPTKCVLAWWNLIFPPNNGAAKIFAVGCEVGEAYSNAIEQILAHPELSQWEYILTLEHDNAPPPDGVMKLVSFTGSHGSTIQAVLDGRADIGSVKSKIFHGLVKKEPGIQEELLIIARSPQLPDTTLFLRKDFPRDRRSQIRDTLLGMDKDAEGLEVLKRLETQKFIEANKSDFRPLASNLLRRMV